MLAPKPTIMHNTWGTMYKSTVHLYGVVLLLSHSAQSIPGHRTTSRRQVHTLSTAPEAMQILTPTTNAQAPDIPQPHTLPACYTQQQQPQLSPLPSCAVLPRALPFRRPVTRHIRNVTQCPTATAPLPWVSW
jgi:hypothetical protein